MRELEAVLEGVDLIGVDETLVREAGRLAEEAALRGYDAVHLATALSLGRPTMATWDRDLSCAAARHGCAVAPGR